MNGLNLGYILGRRARLEMREDGRKRVCIVSLKEVCCLLRMLWMYGFKLHAAAFGLCA